MAGRSGRFRRGTRALWLVPLMLVAACSTKLLSIPISPIRVVDIGRVARAFEDICLGTAPDFRGAGEKFALHDLTDKRAEGITYDGSGTMSVRIDGLDTSDGRKLRCSIVYEDPNRYIAEERIDAMIAKAPGKVQGQRRARFGAAGGGVREGRAWIYTVGERTGEILDVPHAGKGDLGVLILQFPMDE